VDDQQALAIVSALANGANPITGEMFAASSPYQSPDIIRALFVAQRALESRVQRTTVSTSQSTRISTASPIHNAGADDSAAGARVNRRLTNSQSASSDKQVSEKPGKVNAGKPWSADEDKQLLQEFDAEQPLVHIARVHGRTVNGVRARLEKHGRLPPSEATRWSERGSSSASSSSTTQRHSVQAE
jgi:hypothetical protein